MNRTLPLLPDGIVKSAVAQKAQERGLKVVFVNPAGTSQTCPQCGAQGKRTQRDFKCPSSGFSFHADIVGAMNTLRRSLQSFSDSGAEAGDEPAVTFPAPLDLPRCLSVAGSVESHYSLPTVAVDLQAEAGNWRSTATNPILIGKIGIKSPIFVGLNRDYSEKEG